MCRALSKNHILWQPFYVHRLLAQEYQQQEHKAMTIFHHFLSYISNTNIQTWYSALFMSIGLMTVKAFLVLWLNDQGLSISAFSQYRILPCFPSKDVAIPLKENHSSHLFYNKMHKNSLKAHHFVCQTLVYVY